MESPAIGWLAALLVGGLAGWLAEKITGSNMGLLTNIILGVIGAGVGSWLLSAFGIKLAPGWIGYLIAGLIGACVLIFATRLFYPSRWRT